MKTEKRITPALADIGLILLVIALLSTFVQVWVPRLPMEALGVGLVGFSSGYNRPFSRSYLALILISWLFAVIFDPLIWWLMPAFNQGNFQYDWGISLKVNMIVCGVFLSAFLVGSQIGRKSGTL